MGSTAGQHSAGPQNYYGSADDHTSMYTREPPQYADDETLLRGGVPRSSEDNVGRAVELIAELEATNAHQIPDDFKFGGCVAEGTIDIRHAFIRKVYAILYFAPHSARLWWLWRMVADSRSSGRYSSSSPLCSRRSRSSASASSYGSRATHG